MSLLITDECARFLLDAILILLLLFMLTTLPITLYFHFTTGLHPETYPRVQATGAVISAACVFLVTMGWLGRTNNADSIIISVTGVMWSVNLSVSVVPYVSS